MSSTNKLPNSDLNQWVASDRPVMEDFNRDNEIIDGLVGHLKKTPYVGADGCWYVWTPTSPSTSRVKPKRAVKSARRPEGRTGPQGPEGRYRRKGRHRRGVPGAGAL